MKLTKQVQKWQEYSAINTGFEKNKRVVFETSTTSMFQLGQDKITLYNQLYRIIWKYTFRVWVQWKQFDNVQFHGPPWPSRHKECSFHWWTSLCLSMHNALTQNGLWNMIQLSKHPHPPVNLVHFDTIYHVFLLFHGLSQFQLMDFIVLCITL